MKHETYVKSLSRITESIVDADNDIAEEWRMIVSQGNNSSLLDNNVFNASVHNAENLYLVSAVETRDDFSVLYAGMGCLGNVIYCVQAQPIDSETFSLHNFGTVVMKHRDTKLFTPLIFELETSGLKIGRINYLKMGELFDEISKQSDILEDPLDAEAFERHWSSVEQTCGPFITACINRFKHKQAVTSTDDALELIDHLSGYIPSFKSLSYIYFEAVSLAFMLRSEDDTTLNLYNKGEFNHSLYVEMVHRSQVLSGQDQFASYEFKPNGAELRSLMESMIKDGLLQCNMDLMIQQIANNILFYFGTCCGDQSSIRGNAFFDFCKSQSNNKTLSTLLDTRVANILSEHMRNSEYDIVFNSTIEKGEIGICTHISMDKINLYRGVYNDSKTEVTKLEKLSSSIKPIIDFSKFGTEL